MFVNIRRRYCPKGWAKILSCKLFFISSPLIDFTDSQSSVVSDTFISVVVHLVTNLITNFSQHILVKKIIKIDQRLVKIWTKVCGILFGPPCHSAAQFEFLNFS